MSRVFSSSVIPSRDISSLIAARSIAARSMAWSAADTSGKWSCGKSSTSPFGLCSAGGSSGPRGPLPDAWPWTGGLG
eukprot:4089835-Heterocapsa_arctica.AAC.1